MSRYEPRHCDGHVTQLIARCAVDAYDRLVQPMLIRGFRFLSAESLFHVFFGFSVFFVLIIILLYIIVHEPSFGRIPSLQRSFMTFLRH